MQHNNQREVEMVEKFKKLLGDFEDDYSLEGHGQKRIDLFKWLLAEFTTYGSKEYKRGVEVERERVCEVLKKELLTWAKESIGDKALQSLENAITLPLTNPSE